MSKDLGLLVKKLNLKDPKDAYILHAPTKYVLPDVKALKAINELPESVAWLQAFYDLEANLGHELPVLKEHLNQDGLVWICWPKRGSHKPTDLNDTVVRSLGLACGLVDVKVAAINEIWSGLKFVYRVRDRKVNLNKLTL